MPLNPPALDDRSYSDLVADMIAAIPAHTPEWSNPLPGDPGRTLIELFAWLADTILYRANLIPERQRLAFLKLIGQQLQPAAAASGLLGLALDPSFQTPQDVVAGATVTGPVNFETLADVDLLPLTAQVYIKAPIASAQLASTKNLLAGLKTLYNLTSDPQGYLTTPVFATGAEANGIDSGADTIDGCFWIALLCTKPNPAAADLGAVRMAIGGANGQQLLSIGFVPSIVPADPFAPPSNESPVDASWSLSAPPIEGAPVYNALTLVAGEDSTEGLTQTGVVRVIIPQAADIGAPTNDVRQDMQAGVGPKPPRIDDSTVASKLVAWVRLSLATPLAVSWLGINAVSIDQRTTYRAIVVGTSDGSPAQSFSLTQTQIDIASFELEVEMAGLGFVLWQPVDDLSVLQTAAQTYVLDPEAGTVTFGDGVQGAIPPQSGRVRVRSMRAGGGSAGNLPAGSLGSINATDATGRPVAHITVVQPIATTGGADAETLATAQQRIPGLLRHQGRAVTASDYQTLARNAPGAQVARVEVLPLFLPQTRTSGVPGVVSVMVIPPKDGVQPPCPRAQQPLLSTVVGYLSPLRPATAELYVIGTEYVGLGIAVAVEVRSGYSLLEVGQAVETALRTYLWPIAPGGPGGTGWPLGRGVRSFELEVVVSQVPGVVEIDGLALYVPQAAGGYTPLPLDASGRSELSLERYQLVEVLQVAVQAGPDGQEQALPDLTPPTQTDTTVAVPVVPEVC
jgi:hypothetical protein